MTAFLLQYQTILRTVWQKGSRVEKVMMTLVQTTMHQKSSDIAQTFSQAELNALIRDLDLPKISAELLGSRMKSKNLLAPGMSFSWYRNSKEEFTCYFQRLYIAQRYSWINHRVGSYLMQLNREFSSMLTCEV